MELKLILTYAVTGATDEDFKAMREAIEEDDDAAYMKFFEHGDKKPTIQLKISRNYKKVSHD